MSQKITSDLVLELAHEYGFELCGFAKADDLSTEIGKLKEWLSLGYHGGMQYMERNLEKKELPIQILPKVKSVISLGMIYNTKDEHIPKQGEGKISRYAWGDDYHDIMLGRLKEICNRLQETDAEFDYRYYVDTGPVMDKVWAVKAGLGWMGKHTNIINKNMGSWFFIANIFTNYSFTVSTPVEDYCGSCTACIDACPTKAIVQPYVVDANRCLSYLTIENKSDIPEEYSEVSDNWLFGCDVCQDVCPWNMKFGMITEEEVFKPRNGNTSMPLKYIADMEIGDFKKRFEGSPVLRTKLKGLKRNAENLIKAKK